MATITLDNPTRELASRPVFPNGAVAVTPSDANSFSQPVSVYVGVSGNVAITPANGGSSVTFVGLPAGAMVPCQALAVLATGTTATSLVAVY